MLSPKAEQLINSYFNLPFNGIPAVRCPYFNNRKLRQRGQLKVLVGKGTPQEIVEESHIISIQYRAGFFERDGACCLHNRHTGEVVTEKDIRTFLIDNNLGIECSGFVTNVLHEHYLETKQTLLTKKMRIVSPKNLVRWLISRLRPVENINVRTYADEANTTQIMGAGVGYDYSKVEPGDIIILIGKGREHNQNHIILITAADEKKLEYVHARAWSSEGAYGHGVTRGTITITAPGKNLLEQSWHEKDLTSDQNETYLEAKQARVLEIRRLKI